MFTEEALREKTKDQLIKIIMGMQSCEKERGTEKIGEYYARERTAGSKFGDITPEFVANEHMSGKSLAEIVSELNKKFKEEGRVNKAGQPVQISIQVIYHKLKQYEGETGQKIYRPAKKGRKRKV